MLLKTDGPRYPNRLQIESMRGGLITEHVTMSFHAIQLIQDISTVRAVS